MNKEKPKSLIEATFRNPKAKLYRGNILIPAEPLDLEALIQAAAETEEEQDDFRDNGLESVFEELGWPYENLISFYWQSIAPMVWECYLNTLRFADEAELIWICQDFEPFRQGIAIVKQPSNRAVMSAFFRALIKENGAMFGVELFGSLPSNTDNHREDLIPEKVVRAAYWNWLMWAEGRLDVDWYAMAQEILARDEDPIMYPLKLLRGVSAGFDGDAARWLQECDEQNDQLSQRAKRAIFDAYFKQSYGPY